MIDRAQQGVPYRSPEDRTFKGYDLYAEEVRRAREADKAKLAKYKDREGVIAAVFIAGLLMLVFSMLAWIYAPVCR